MPPPGVSCQLGSGSCFTRSTEESLRNQLMTGYNREVRPDQVTKVFMLFHVTSIATVDIRNELFSINGWWSMRWHDERLEWTSHPTIPVVQFNENRLWTPVIVVSNSVDDLSAVAESSIPLRVDRNGTVNWNPPGIIRVSCTMDITYFPFDTQKCGIEVTSFGYTIQEMDVKLYNDGMSFRYYSESGEWDITGTDSVRTEYEEDGYTYARATFYLTIKRKPLYYGLNMLLPVITCSALTLFVFLLPPESGEKIGYCLTVLLAFMVILTLVAQDLPTTASSTSILEVYIAVVLIMGGLSVVLSIIILHIFFLPEEKPIGPFTEMLTRFFMTCCCAKGCCNCRSQAPKIEPGSSLKHNGRMTGRKEKSSSSINNIEDPLNQTWREKQTPPLGYEDTNQWPPISHMQMSTHTNHGMSMHDIPRATLHERPRLIKEQSGIGSFRPQSAHSSGSRNSRGEVPLTWQMVSRTLDDVMFKLYAVFLFVSSVVFVTVMALN